MEGKIKEPRPVKTKVFLWADASYNDMEEIDNINSIPELESVLCRVLRVDVSEPRKGVLLELYVQAVLFCRQSKFNSEQTSALLSIIKNVHQANTETPLNNMDHCFEYCRELLLCHSVMHPPFSINLFNSEEVTQIIKYLLNSYIRHYNLYKYIFTPQIRLDLTLSYSDMTDEDEPKAEESVPSNGEAVEESVPEQAKEHYLVAQESLNSVPDDAKAGLSPKSELRTLVQQEVREEIMRISGQLEQRLKESTEQLNSTLTLLEANLHAQK